MIRYPAPLRPGDTIGVTSPSAGVTDEEATRIDFCIEWLRGQGYDVVVGDCMDGTGITSAAAERRAAELTDMLCDPTIRCVLPPWGGETAVDMVDLLDWERLAQADPTWFVGFSDISTLLVPVTTRLGWATLHGDNLADTPYGQPTGLLSWREIARGAGPHVQADSGLIGDWWGLKEHPHATTWREAGHGRWRLHGAESLTATGRLIGGCIETMVNIAGTPFGDVAAFGAQHADDGLIVYLEACEDNTLAICRHLHSLRLAGWFEHARAILIGRPGATGGTSDIMPHDEAVLDALGRLGIPIVFDVEIGHVPPHLPLVNGALATVTVDGDRHEIVQEFR